MQKEEWEIGEDLKSFISHQISLAKSQERQRIVEIAEGMKRKEDSEWRVGVDDGDGYDEAIPYNQALNEIIALTRKE